MPIVANVTQNQITATVGETQIGVSVGTPSPIGVTVSGVGQQGPTGPTGPAGSTTLAALTDVELAEAANGDVLRYSSNRWRNYPELNLTDGGNY